MSKKQQPLATIFALFFYIFFAVITIPVLFVRVIVGLVRACRGTNKKTRVTPPRHECEYDYDEHDCVEDDCVEDDAYGDDPDYSWETHCEYCGELLEDCVCAHRHESHRDVGLLDCGCDEDEGDGLGLSNRNDDEKSELFGFDKFNSI